MARDIVCLNSRKVVQPVSTSHSTSSVPVQYSDCSSSCRYREDLISPAETSVPNALVTWPSVLPFFFIFFTF